MEYKLLGSTFLSLHTMMIYTGLSVPELDAGESRSFVLFLDVPPDHMKKPETINMSNYTWFL